MTAENKIDSQLHGIWKIIPSAAITEIIAQSGYDFQILDCEHGGYDYQTLEQDIRACELYNCLPFVRVSGLSKVEVQRCLDMGAAGIVFPQLSTFEDFEAAARSIKYAPDGTRGFNPFVRSAQYGLKDDTKPVKPLCIVIIETVEAVNNLERILALPTIDMVYIGSYDLSAQLNCIGEMNDPKLVAVVDKIIETCKAANKPVGLMVNNADQFNRFEKKGVTVFVHTVDSHQIKRALTNTLNEFK